MSAVLQQQGHGEVRPLVVWYYLGSKELLDTLDSSCCVVTSGADGKFHYINSDNPTLDSIKKTYGERFNCSFSTVMLAGFSAGCQGVRTQLLENQVTKPSGLLVCDGVHSSEPPQQWQLDVWRDYLATCNASLPKVSPSSSNGAIRWTCSNITPTGFTGTRETLNLVTGLDTQPGESLEDPNIYQSGRASFLTFPGTDADAHIYQATTVLPKQHLLLAQSLGIASNGNKVSPGETPGETPSDVQRDLVPIIAAAAVLVLLLSEFS